MNVTSAFLNGVLEEEVYVQPMGYVARGQEKKVLKLRRLCMG